MSLHTDIHASTHASGGDDALIGPLALSSGSAAACAVAFTGEAGTGFFKQAAGAVGFASAGTEVSRFTATQILAPSGSAATPGLSFLGDTDTGIYPSAANTLGFAAAGANVATLSATQMSVNFLGSASVPAYSFLSDTDTGIYSRTANTLGFSTGGAHRGEIDSTSLRVGSTTAYTYLKPPGTNGGVLGCTTDSLVLEGYVGTFLTFGDSHSMRFAEVWGPNLYTVHKVWAYNSLPFDAAALTDSAEVYRLYKNWVLWYVTLRLKTRFVASGMTDLRVTIGDAGDNDGFITQTGNLTTDSVGTVYTLRGAYWNAATAAGYGYWGGSTYTEVNMYTTATGANLNTLTAGELEVIWVALVA